MRRNGYKFCSIRNSNSSTTCEALRVHIALHLRLNVVKNTTEVLHYEHRKAKVLYKQSVPLKIRQQDDCQINTLNIVPAYLISQCNL